MNFDCWINGNIREETREGRKEGRDRCCQNVTRRQGNELLQDKEAEKEEEEEEEVHSG